MLFGFSSLNAHLNKCLNTYIETLCNFDRDDGETILKPQGWFNAINLPDALTDNQLNQAHNDFKDLSEENQKVVKLIQAENTKNA